MLFEFGGLFRKVWRVALILGTFVIGANTLFVAPVSAASGVNQQLNFQGRLLNAQGAIVPDGYYNVEFKIYQDGTGTAAGNPSGTLKWTEDWLNSGSSPVRVVNGYMSVQLGSINPFGNSVDWNQDTLWLSINIGNTNVSCTPFSSCAGDGEMLPMKRLSAVPYALNSARLGGLTAAGFIQNTTTVQTATNMAIDGTARADTKVLTPAVDTNTAVTLNIGTTTASSISIGRSGTTTTVNGNLTLGSSQTFTNGGATVNGTLALGNFATGGSIGSAGTTVDVATSFTVNQTTASQTLTIPNPSNTAIVGRTIYLSNIGSATFTVGGFTIASNGTAQFIWNGSAWTLNGNVGGSGNFIQNGTTQQTANFNISGSGTAGTSVLTPLLDTASVGILSIGTANATNIALNQNVTVAANKSLTLAGGTTANRPASPTEGMLWYDTTTKQLLVYANGKWKSESRTATKVVAASDSSQQMKDGADYVADGTNDQAEINTAIAALPTSGGSVYLAGGNFSIGGQITLTDSVSLTGDAGRGATLNRAFTSGSYNGVIFVHGFDTAITNLTIDGKKGTYGATTNHDIFQGDGAGGTKIKNNNIYSAGGLGILMSGNAMLENQNSIIDDNTVYGNQGDGIGGSFIFMAQITNNKVSYNNRGIIIGDSDNLTVSGNAVKNNTGNGIEINAGSVSISNNTSSYNGGDGIKVVGESNTVSANTTFENVYSGISLSDTRHTVVSGNTSSYDGTGIKFEGGTGESEVTVTGNNINYPTTHGIYLHGNGIENDTISSNTISYAGGNGSSSGITISNSDGGVSIINNTIIDDQGTGYAIDNNGTGTYLSGNMYSGTGANSIHDTGTGTIYGGQVNASGNYLIQPAGTINLMKNTNVTGTLNASVSVLSPTVDVASTGTLSIGTTTATAISIGKSGVTTTVVGPLAINPQTSTSTTLLCTNAGVVSTCDSSVLAPTATNFIQNQNASTQAANFNINGTGTASTLNATTALQTAGTTRVDASGNLSNIGNIAATGTTTLTGVTNATTSALQVNTNSTGSTATAVTIQQQGSGNTTLEMKNSTEAWSVGVDSADSNTFKINSSGAAATTTTFGNTTTGNTNDSGDNNDVNAAKYTSSATGNVISLSVYTTCAISASPNNQFRMALYSDNGSGTAPSTLLAQSSASTLVSGWNQVSIPSTAVTSGSIYWIAYNSNGTASNNNCFRVTTSAIANEMVWVDPYAFGAMPSTWPGNTGTSVNTPVFYATIQTSTATNTYANSLLQLTDTGRMTLRNTLNSTSAFQIQNAAGTSVLNVNTSSNELTVAGNLTVTNAGSVAFQAGANYSTVGSTNDVSLGTGVLFRLTGASAQTLTGIAGGLDGRIITLVNAAANAATLNNDSTSSAAANRIITGTGANMPIAPGAAVQLAYDATSSRWRVVGGSAVTGGAANQQLSNLSGTVAVNLTLAPGGTTNTLDIGSSSQSWRTGYFGTSVLTPLLDTATATTLNIGTTNATSVSINKNTTIASGMSLTLAGGTTANRPASPTEGMLWYDTTTKQLLTYSNGKWQADKSDAILVAASNSSQADKDAANYVGDGNTATANDGDQVQINAALTAAAGKKVVLLAGTYVDDAAISIPNNTTLAGVGNGTIVQLADLDATANLITNTDTTTGAGVVIRDLKLDGQDTLNTAGTQYGVYLNNMGDYTSNLSGSVISNVRVDNFRSAGVFYYSSDGNIMENSTVNGMDVGGATLGVYYDSASRNNRITSTLFSSNSYAIRADGSGSTNNTFNDNSFRTNNYGINLYGAIHTTVSGNNFDGTTNHAVDLYADAATSTYNTVVSNTFRASGVAVAIYNTSDNEVSGNKIHDSGSTTNNNGIQISLDSDRNLITNNAITDSSATVDNYGITILNSTADSTYLASNTLGTSTVNNAGTGTIFAGQYSTSTSYLIQPATGITIGSSTTTTTIQGTLQITPQTSTSTTLLCSNTGIVSTCDSSVLTPTATNFIQNQNTVDQTANFRINGTARANTSVLTPLLDTASAGTLSLGTSTATGITLGKTGVATTTAGGLLTSTVDTASAGALTIGTSTATSVTIGKSAIATNLSSSTINVGTSGAATTISGATQATANTAGNAMTIKGSDGLGSGAGGTVTIQGGNAGTTSGANGGNLVLAGGTGASGGVGGLVVINSAAYSTSTTQASASNVNVTQANIDAFGAIILNATAASVNFTLTSPTLGTNATGRVIYVTAANGSQDFTLRANVGGGTGVEQNIAMRQNTTATMIWNGSQWTAAGASSSTTLQAAYDNTLQSAGGAELVVSKTTATNGLTIRDSAVNSVNGTLLSVQTSSAAGLLSVNSNVTEYASNAGAETAGASATTFPSSTWTALTGTTTTRYNVAGNYVATGQGSVSNLTTAVANTGVKNQLVNSSGVATALTANTAYNVSFTTRLLTGTFTDMNVWYSADGTNASVACTTTATAATSVWTKVNCTFTTPTSGISSVNAIFIRQTTAVARTFYVDNLSVTIAADYNFATDGHASDAANFSTNWTAAGSATVTQNTGDGYDASNSAQAVTTATANVGVRNKLSSNPLPSTLYRITVYAKSSTSFTDFRIRYSRDGTNFDDCVDYNTQTVSTSQWTKVTCYVTTSATVASTPYVYFLQTAASARTFYVDAFSMTLRTSTTPNVQVGGGVNGGPTTLFTLDKGASAPIASDNDALLGSMYYDTTLGKLQCYEADGWGACGSSPDTVVTISPEYNNAVMHGTGVGTMTSDICSDTLNINDGSSSQPTICGTNDTYNIYKWTSPQASLQTYSIYVTYQLPSTFKEFASGQTSIMGRIDSSTNANLTYQVFRSSTTGGLSPCGSTVNITTASPNTWQTLTASGAADPSTCGFEPGDSVVFKINMTASGTYNSYVSNLNFIFSNR